ncbi:hypothetical protein NDU88_002167, partial [Pleurodeles waltl]
LWTTTPIRHCCAACKMWNGLLITMLCTNCYFLRGICTCTYRDTHHYWTYL